MSRSSRGFSSSLRSFAVRLASLRATVRGVRATAATGPTFRAPLLDAVAQAFASRRSAIRHGARSFTIECEAEAASIQPPERLNVAVSTTSPRRVQLRLSLWPNGGLWVWAGSGVKNGSQFSIAFHGQLQTPRPNGVVRWYEQSLELLSQIESIAECKEPLLEIWREVSPTLEYAA